MGKGYEGDVLGCVFIFGGDSGSEFHAKVYDIGGLPKNLKDTRETVHAVVEFQGELSVARDLTGSQDAYLLYMCRVE